MVWLVIAIPLTAVVMGVTTIILAVVSDDGIVADDYYRRGLEINQSLERDRMAVRHGLNAVVMMDTDAKVVPKSAFHFPDRIELSFSHATKSGLDISLTLTRTARRSYQAGLPELSLGRWYMQLHSREWRLNGVLQVPGQNEVILDNDTTLSAKGPDVD
jgi:hypothetical protein